jgi:hypothetical protein
MPSTRCVRAHGCPRQTAPTECGADTLTAPEAVSRLPHCLRGPYAARTVGPRLVRRPPTPDSQLASASSSRTQVPVRTTSAVAGVACDGPCVDVRWRPPLAVAVVTHFVTQSLYVSRWQGSTEPGFGVRTECCLRPYACYSVRTEAGCYLPCSRHLATTGSCGQSADRRSKRTARTCPGPVPTL